MKALLRYGVRSSLVADDFPDATRNEAAKMNKTEQILRGRVSPTVHELASATADYRAVCISWYRIGQKNILEEIFHALDDMVMEAEESVSVEERNDKRIAKKIIRKKNLKRRKNCVPVQDTKKKRRKLRKS